ncbi:NAD-dependent epimerase/dehydratase family protein [Papillibacter cinnamivorans]|nr:NAD-dependent epimerase/dehydratase family protein [Papillibacter cinnamivorans]
MNAVVRADLARIYEDLTAGERAKFAGTTLLFTGCAGFFGFYLLNFFTRYREELGIREIIGLDSFRMGYPNWLKEMDGAGQVTLRRFDIASDDLGDAAGAERADYIFHMASIASPVFYRRYPVETIDANVWGLRMLLEFYKSRNIRGMLYFSTSEIYGDPDPAHIPTAEDYRGSVSCNGPRACYDEGKRFGETLCSLFAEKYGMPLTVVRPFNNYGPGMRLNDARVPADFADAVRRNRDIEIYSDGTPTRTFCYISDSVPGFIKAALYGRYDTFNIGMDRPELSVAELAEIYLRAGREIFGYTGNIRFEKHSDEKYLTDNPNRRCPDLGKARRLLGYRPKIDVVQGVGYFLEHIKASAEGELVW